MNRFTVAPWRMCQLESVEDDSRSAGEWPQSTGADREGSMMVTTTRGFVLGTGGAVTMLVVIALSGAPEPGPLMIDGPGDVVDRPSVPVQLRRAEASKARRDARTTLASLPTGAATPAVAASHAAHQARHARRNNLINLNRNEPLSGPMIRHASRDDRSGNL